MLSYNAKQFCPCYAFVVTPLWCIYTRKDNVRNPRTLIPHEQWWLHLSVDRTMVIAPVSKPVIREVNIVYSLQKLYDCNVSVDVIDEYNGSIVELPVPIASNLQNTNLCYFHIIPVFVCTHPALAVKNNKPCLIGQPSNTISSENRLYLSYTVFGSNSSCLLRSTVIIYCPTIRLQSIVARSSRPYTSLC